MCCIFWQLNCAVNYQELGKKEKNLLHYGYYPWEFNIMDIMQTTPQNWAQQDKE